MYSIKLDDGKYEIQYNNSNPFSFKALRYGEEWRDLTGDNLILSLVYRIEELEEIIHNKKWG